MKQNFIE